MSIARKLGTGEYFRLQDCREFNSAERWQYRWHWMWGCIMDNPDHYHRTQDSRLMYQLVEYSTFMRESDVPVECVAVLSEN